MLSPWYDEFLDEEDYWFLLFTVGRTLDWEGIMRTREEERVIAVLKGLCVKVNEIVIFPRVNQRLAWSLLF